MIINTQTTLALRCPACGKVNFHRVSLFGLGKERRMECSCSCGEREIMVGKIPGGVWLQVNCFLCEDVHLVKMSSKEFCGKRLLPIHCPNAGDPVAFLGPEREVRRYLKDVVGQNADSGPDPVLSECFKDPDVMYAILSHLHTLALEERIVCPCGNKDVEVQVEEALVRVICPNCHRYATVHAATHDDVDYVKNLVRLELQPSRSSTRSSRKQKGCKRKE